MVSLLRRKRNNIPNKTPTPSAHRPSRELSHSLSLPDLTAPLLDPSSWEEVPGFLSSIPSLPNSKSANHIINPKALFSSNSSTSTSGKNRSPAFVGGSPGSVVAFHKPFGSWQVINNPTQVDSPVPACVYRGDFRKSTWFGTGEFGRDVNGREDGRSGRESVHASHVGAGGVKRRKKGRVADSLNVMLVGGRGVGKTSLLRSLRDTSPYPDAKPPLPSSRLSPSRQNQTPCSPTTLGPPLTTSSPELCPLSSSVASSPSLRSPPSPNPSSPAPLQRPNPTTRLSSSVITLDRPAEKIQLCLIDTPGLDLRADDGPALHARQRERGLQALMSVAEERFWEVLREESKVVGRQLSGGSGLIHLCLYIIDSRAVLHPAEVELDIDWSGLSMSDNSESPSPDDMKDIKPNLSQVEIDIIKRLSERMNVLPILTHADCLSTPELAAVRLAVRRGLGIALGGEGRGFGVFGGTGSDERAGQRTPVATIEPSVDHSPHKLLSPQDICPPSPFPMITSPAAPSDEDDSPLPFAIFAPATISGGTREYPWGTADVIQALDIERLREAVLDTHAKELRMTTREVLYERYRTEHLLATRAKRGLILAGEDAVA